LTAQTGVVFDRLSQRLADAGATMDDVVKINTYIVDFEPDADMRPFSQGRASVFGEQPPSSTLVGIDRLVSDQIQIEVDAVAVVEDGGRGERLTTEFHDPAGSFTQVVTAQGDGAKTIYVSGQVGRPGESIESQARQAFAGMQQRLALAGATPADLVKVIYYLPGYTPGNTGIAGAREANGFPTENLPASTLLGIRSLYSETALFEYEGIAVVR
jgi:enamine deaminase RidA (YjgF/YER057c/UK114 family)